MILRLINDGTVTKHEEKTVRDFIDNIIYKTEDRHRFSYRYKTDYMLNRMFDDDELKNFIKEQDDDRFKEVVSILCDKVLENESNILSLKNIINNHARDIYILEQQIKWLSEKIAK